MHALVYVIAKAPRAGHAKTRLSPPLPLEHAARLAGAFLLDTMDAARQAEVDVRLICRDAEERAALLPLAGPARVDVQRGQGLGAALESAFALGLADGYARVGVLGADLPTLPPSMIAEAFAGLDHADVALGPSDDGGYYLLASRQVYPPLFRDMVWSTSQVAQETLRRCTALALRTHLLATWPDVDDAAALRRLRAALQAIAPNVAPHTRAALSEVMSEE